MDKLRRGWELFNEVLRHAAGIIILMMMLTVCYQVAVRYVFRSPTGWIVDANTYAITVMVFLIVCWIQMKKKHIKMEAVVTLLSPKARSYVNLVTSVLTLVFAVSLTWISWDLALRALRGGHAFLGGIDIPEFPIRVIIPIGAGLLSVQVIIDIISHIASLRGDWAKALNRVYRLVARRS